MKGSAIQGPVAKECADLWRASPFPSPRFRPAVLILVPAAARIASNAGTVV